MYILPRLGCLGLFDYWRDVVSRGQLDLPVCPYAIYPTLSQDNLWHGSYLTAAPTWLMTPVPFPRTRCLHG